LDQLAATAPERNRNGHQGEGLITITKAADPAYPADFHFGIMMNSSEEVEAKHQELFDAGRQPENIKSFEAVGSIWTSFMCPIGDGMKIGINHRTRLAPIES
jgi:hypothetical protein